MTVLKHFLRDERGATAAEFALVLPISIFLLLGVIDVGNYAWSLNEYEKATQMGTRYAVVTDVIPPALTTESYLGYSCDGANLSPGDRICSESLGRIICDRAGCTCDANAGTCPSGTLSPPDTVIYDALVDRMQEYQPRIPDDGVIVEYAGSGLGYAGDPNKPEIAPLVTVRVKDLNFTPISLSPFGANVPLPDFSYTLTLEDAEGSDAS